MKTDDTQLVSLAQAGDRRALGELLEKHAGFTHRVAVRLCGNPDDADDVLQETLLAASGRLREFRGEAAFPSWLFAVARSFCARSRRRPRPEPRNPAELSALPLVDGARAADEALDAARAGRLVQASLDRLPREQKEILVLRDIEGLRGEEVAAALGLTIPAMKSRLHRARAALRGELAGAVAARPPEGGSPCPDVVTLWSRHLEGELSPEVCARMEHHLDDCPGCRERCQSLRDALALCRASPTPEVPADTARLVRAALRSVREIG